MTQDQLRNLTFVVAQIGMKVGAADSNRIDRNQSIARR